MTLFKAPTHFFNLDPRKNTRGEQLILFNLNYGYRLHDTISGKVKYKGLRISTKLRVEARYWDAVNYVTNKDHVRRYGKTINDQLNRIHTAAHNSVHLYRSENEKDPEPAVLKELVLQKLGRKNKILKTGSVREYLSKKIEHLRSLPASAVKKVSNGTIKSFENTMYLIDQYNKVKGPLLFHELTEETYWSFFDVINEEYKKSGNHPYGYTVNNMAKTSKNLLSILRSAVDDEAIHIPLNVHKKGLKIMEYRSSNEAYLSEHHLQKVIAADVTHSSELLHAKNYLIISCFTGLRYEDMCNLHELKVETFKGRKRNFKGFTTKVGKVSKETADVLVSLPVLKPVSDLLEQYGGRFPKVIKSQPLNRNLKKLGKVLEFEEPLKIVNRYYKVPEFTSEVPLHSLLETHTGRKSFTTNLLRAQIPYNMINDLTHPKTKSKTMAEVYNNSSRIDKAELLLDSLDLSTSTLYKV